MPSSRRRRRTQKPLWPKILLAGAIVLLLGILTMVLWPAPEAPQPKPQPEQNISLELAGEDSVTLEYGEAFQDPGAVALRYEADQSYPLEVQTTGTVDSTKLGTYTITYTVSYEGKKLEKVRTVTIVDTKCPVIELVSNPDAYTPIGQTYQEEGFKATDNYDGDITDKVERIPSEDGKTVTYRVADSSGNAAEIIRNITFKDATAPVLTLKGSESFTMTAGEKWTDPGYSAMDNVDGDISAKVKVSGKVDIYSAGTYTLRYQVTDSSGNTATKERVVTVKPVSKPQPEEPQGQGKVIYLTFDDGPGVHTERLLGVLAKYDVKATFFVCKTGHLSLLDDIAQGGHTIGIHSKTHKYSKIYASTDAFFEDFYAMRDLIVEYAGVEPTVMRFPGGSSNRVSANYCKGIMTKLTKAIQDLGYQYFDWNIDSNDAGGTKTADGVFRNVTSQIAKSKQSHFFVLQHDIHGYSVDAVERIIQWGLEHGYTFAALDVNSPVSHHTVRN